MALLLYFKRMKTRLKEFLRPTRGKIIIVGALLVLGLSFRSVQVIFTHPTSFDTFFGFPLPYYMIHEGYIKEDSEWVLGTWSSWTPFPFGLFALLVDVIFWYFISCFIIVGYDRVRGKRK
jgi:hypothetical protein